MFCSAYSICCTTMLHSSWEVPLCSWTTKTMFCQLFSVKAGWGVIDINVLLLHMFDCTYLFSVHLNWSYKWPRWQFHWESQQILDPHFPVCIELGYTLLSSHQISSDLSVQHSDGFIAYKPEKTGLNCRLWDTTLLPMLFCYFQYFQ